MQLHNSNLGRKELLRNPYPLGFAKVNVKPSKSGDWEVSKFTIDADKIGFHNLRLIIKGHPWRIIPPGRYTKLTYNEAVVMTDTPAEAHEHRTLLAAVKRTAGANVLLNGLGLGFALNAILRQAVKHVTVIEKSADVIKLIKPSITRLDDRVSIIHADALDWRPPKSERYDVVWHDIWDDICIDNKKQMTFLKRAYSRRCSWQGCWSSEYM